MAKSTTPRLGLSLFSADTDNHGGREQHNADHAELEKTVAVWKGKGLLSNRGTPGVEGRFYVSTNQGDGGQLSVDVGDKWLEVSVLGGGGAPPPVVIGGSGSEGVSQRAMRSDARVSMPLATAKAPGAMSAGHAEMLDSATSAVSPWSLVYRDSGSRARFASPTESSHAATKGWVDGLGTHLIRPGELIRRWDGNGTVHMPDPVAPSDAANKRYVDSKASREEWKTDVEPMTEGLDELCALDLNWWAYRDDAPYTGDGAGPMVAQVAQVAPRFATDGEDGDPERVRDRDAIWWVARALQQSEARRAHDSARFTGKIRRLESTVADLVRIVNDLTPNTDGDV